MKQNWERQKKTEKENNNDKRDLRENEMPDLNSLNSFDFQPKTNIGDINSNSSDDEEEGAEHEVKGISKRSGASAVKKQYLANVLQNRC